MKQFTIQLTALLFILLWTYAAFAKLTDMDKFHGQMAQSPLILTLAAGLKWIVPSVELVLSIALMFRTTRYWAIIGSTFLIACFCWYIIAITHFSTYVPCSCGGVLEKLSWNEHLVVNFFFLILGTISLLIYKDNPYSNIKSVLQYQGKAENL